jgi:hypothetical protein
MRYLSFSIPVLISYVVLMALSTQYSLAKSKRILRANTVWLCADTALYEWRIRNPGVYIGLSEKGRALVLAALAAYDSLVRLYPKRRNDHYRNKLLSLLDDFPPKTPHEYPTTEDDASASSFLCKRAD